LVPKNQNFLLGLHGKLATAQLRAKTQVLEERMTDEERTNEAQVRQKQLEKIFEMMEGQKDKFGINEKEELVCCLFSLELQESN
jgi:hypothetical protein